MNRRAELEVSPRAARSDLPREKIWRARGRGGVAFGLGEHYIMQFKWGPQRVQKKLGQQRLGNPGKKVWGKSPPEFLVVAQTGNCPVIEIVSAGGPKSFPYRDLAKRPHQEGKRGQRLFCPGGPIRHHGTGEKKRLFSDLPMGKKNLFPGRRGTSFGGHSGNTKALNGCWRGKAFSWHGDFLFQGRPLQKGGP